MLTFATALFGLSPHCVVAQTGGPPLGLTVVDATGKRLGVISGALIFFKVQGEFVGVNNYDLAVNGQLYFSSAPAQPNFTSTDCTGQAYLTGAGDFGVEAKIVPPNSADYATLLAQPIASGFDLVYPTRPFSTLTLRSSLTYDASFIASCTEFIPPVDDYVGTMKTVHSNTLDFTPPLSLQ